MAVVVNAFSFTALKHLPPPSPIAQLIYAGNITALIKKVALGPRADDDVTKADVVACRRKRQPKRGADLLYP